jgi:hypothetical protein
MLKNKNNYEYLLKLIGETQNLLCQVFIHFLLVQILKCTEIETHFKVCFRT